MSERETPEINVADILQRHANSAGVPVDVLVGRSKRSKQKDIFHARLDAQRDMREAGLTIVAIGDATNRDHGTVSSGLNGLRDEVPLGEEIIVEAQLYLDANFPGVTLEDVRSLRRQKQLSIPRQAVERHLFYDRGANIYQIAGLIGRDHSSIIHAINEDQEFVDNKVRSWQEAEGRRVPLREIGVKKEEIAQKEKERKKRQEIVVKTVLAIVPPAYSVDLEAILSTSRFKKVMIPRAIIQYILHRETDLSYVRIARLVGRSDHTTAISAINTVEKIIGVDEYFKEDVEALIAEVNKRTAELM